MCEVAKGWYPSWNVKFFKATLYSLLQQTMSLFNLSIRGQSCSRRRIFITAPSPLTLFREIHCCVPFWCWPNSWNKSVVGTVQLLEGAALAKSLYGLKGCSGCYATKCSPEVALMPLREDKERQSTYFRQTRANRRSSSRMLCTTEISAGTVQDLNLYSEMESSLFD